MKTYQHTSVLLDQAVDGLNVRPDGIYIDGTFGRGGHSRLILSRLGPRGRLIAIDRDPQAIAAASKIEDKRFFIIHGTFAQLKSYVMQQDLIGKIDGVLLDLGVSSPQLDDPQRGFSFMRDGPLDMRMDPSTGVSAMDWLQHADEQEIAAVLKNLGEERFAKRIARAIVTRNQQQAMTRTRELAEVVAAAIPSREKHKHPATRTFQAIRIYINAELEQISAALEGIVLALAPAGRLVVISFHSLEDRIVKRFIRQQSQGPNLPAGLPLTEAQVQAFSCRKLKTIGKLMADDNEANLNPRARSAVLRIAERVGE